MDDESATPSLDAPSANTSSATASIKNTQIAPIAVPKSNQDSSIKNILTPTVSRTSLRNPLARKVTSIRTIATTDASFEIDFGDHDDTSNPKNWPVWYKGIAVAAISWSTWTVAVYSTSYTAGLPDMEREFHQSEPVVTLGVTTYLIGLAIGSLILAPLSEIYGRRPVYIVSNIIFMILVIPCAVAKNLATLLAVRFFSAVAGAAMVANSPGTVSDIATEEYRALVFSFWSIGPLNGPVVGPIIGGFATQYLGWRFSNWIIMMLSAVSCVAVIILKETYAPAILRKRAEQRRIETGDSRWWSRYDHKTAFVAMVKLNLSRPFVMAVTEPICIFWNLYVAIVYAILYLCFVAYPIVFSQARGWSVGISGLAFLGIGIGTCSSLIAEPLIRRMVHAHKPDPSTGRPPPEAQVAIICVASILIPIGQLWFSWTCIPPVHWVWPILAGIPFGAGNTIVFIYAINYMAGSYGIFAASALAGNAVVRSVLGGILPLAGPRMYASLGPHWAGTLLGLVQVICIPIPFVFWKYGGKIREKSVLIGKMRQEADRLDGKRNSKRAKAPDTEAQVDGNDGDTLSEKVTEQPGVFETVNTQGIDDDIFEKPSAADHAKGNKDLHS
ncbi:hypothetical protein MMC25_003662 [Agyrium rufum]|nr:hypothetical protein [Agyrium rufum]